MTVNSVLCCEEGIINYILLYRFLYCLYFYFDCVFSFHFISFDFSSFFFMFISCASNRNEFDVGWISFGLKSFISPVRLCVCVCVSTSKGFGCSWLMDGMYYAVCGLMDVEPKMSKWRPTHWRWSDEWPHVLMMMRCHGARDTWPPDDHLTCQSSNGRHSKL